MTSKKTGLYPYTLQPIALDMTDAEFKAAQLSLFEKGSNAYTLKALKPKEWGVLGVIVALAIAGLVFIDGYSTIMFWLMLVGVVIYLLLRTLGLKWYVKREFDKQISEMNVPDEMYKMKLGVQNHGLIMAMPVKQELIQSPQMRGMTMRAAPMQQGVIPWGAVDSWDETDNFIFVMFELQGQKGSQIIPKRLQSKGLPINTIVKHLTEVKAKGLQTSTFTP